MKVKTMSESLPVPSISSLFSGPPRYVPDTAWGPISAFLMTVLICFVSVVSVLAAIVWVTASGTPAAEVDSAVEAMSSLTSPIGFATALGAQLLSLVVCWLAAGRGGLRRETLQLADISPSLRAGFIGGLIVLAVTSVAELLMYFTTAFDIFTDSKWIADGLRSPYWWGTALVAVVFAPLWEELTFRGFLLSALAKTRLGIVGAGLISNTIWSALHANYSWQGVVSVFLAGIVLTWLVWRTGSIWVSIIAHAMINIAALTFTYLYSPLG